MSTQRPSATAVLATQHYNRGSELYAGGDLEAALACFRQAAQLAPGLTLAHYNAGVVCQQLQRNDEAEAAYRAALNCDAGYFDALTNLVVVLRRQADKGEQALQAALLAVQAVPDDADNWNNLALVARDRGDLESAQACIDKALSLDANKAEYAMNMGSVLLDARRVDESIAYFKRAIELDAQYAEAHMNLGFALLLAGDYARGWQEYEWRLRVPGHRNNYLHIDRPLWNGENPAGRTILICAEQGLGDTLQFVRYAATLVARGARVCVECQAPLLRLLAHSQPGIDFVAPGAAVPPFDCWLPMMSLPRALGVELAGGFPYLRADPAKVSAFAALLGAKPDEPRRPRVGLVWSGDPRPHDVNAHRVDQRRSLHFRQLAPIVAVGGIDFFSVQKGRPAAQLNEVDGGSALIDHTEQLGDFADTAALLMHLDLLITVDTSMAHLAGALGVPVWMLSRFDGCWRWLLAGSTTPWYPSMTIYRQETPGDWAAVIARVKDDLTAFVARVPD